MAAKSKECRGDENVTKKNSVSKGSKKRMPTLTKVVIITAIIAAAYTVAVFVSAWCEVEIPDSLTYSFFAAVAGEFGVSGMIRCSKNKYFNRED